MDARIEREKSFHEKRFGEGKEGSQRDDVPKALAPFMPSLNILRPSLQATYKTIATQCVDGDVLDYGCSFGEASLYCLRQGARSTFGIDISENAINTATAEAKAQGFDNAHFEAMNAEVMTFDTNRFDFACGFGIIHHLDVDKSSRELSRVLKPDGSAVFLEPLGHNFFINRFRDMTPEARTEDEHPLLASDFDIMRRYFGSVELEFFNLFTLPMLPFARVQVLEPFIRGLSALDRAMFKMAPFVGRYAWNVVIRLSSPTVEA